MEDEQSLEALTVSSQHLGVGDLAVAAGGANHCLFRRQHEIPISGGDLLKVMGEEVDSPVPDAAGTRVQRSPIWGLLS